MVEDTVDEFFLLKMGSPVDAHLLGDIDQFDMGFVFQFGNVEHKFSLQATKAYLLLFVNILLDFNNFSISRTPTIIEV